MKLLRLAFAVALLVLAVAPAGCRSAEKQSDQVTGVSYESGYGYGSADGDTRDELQVGGAGSVTHDTYASKVAPEEAGRVASTERMIVRNAYLEMRVKDVNDSVDRLRAAIRAHDAEIAELSLSGGDVRPLDAQATGPAGPTYASIVVRVPSSRLDALTTALAKLGTVVSQSESASDVTEQAIDMEARLKNLHAEEKRLRSFLDKTNDVSELLEVQKELARVRGDIESMDAQLTYLKRQVAKATLSVTLTQPGPVAGTEDPWFGIREAFARGIQGAIDVVETLITFVIAMLPVAIFVGLTVWSAVAVVRARRRRSRKTGTSESGSRAEAPAGENADDTAPAAEEDVTSPEKAS